VGDVVGLEVNGDHSYDKSGVYTVLLTVTDDGGNTGESLFQFIVIFDPEGGFVTGGGWIDSPSEACHFEDCNDQTTGKATFGFVSKYKKGQNAPIGQTEFQFKAGNLNFHSTSYDWLVIAGPNAKYKGDGTVNNQGDYGFMLTACDVGCNGSCLSETDDTFRIKIWDTKGTDDEFDDEVIYDNKWGAVDDSNAGTVLGGGNIKIHKGINNRVAENAGEPTETLKIAEEVPEAFALAQNYPNPFNPSTEIRFDLPQASPVRLVVYNAMGQEVARLVDQPLHAGTHSVTWDASGLPSGVYLYRLTAGAFIDTKAMTLLK